MSHGALCRGGARLQDSTRCVGDTQQRLNKDSTKTQRLKAQRLKTRRLKDSKTHQKKRKLRTVNGDRTHDGVKLTPGAVPSTLFPHLCQIYAISHKPYQLTKNLLHGALRRKWRCCIAISGWSNWSEPTALFDRAHVALHDSACRAIPLKNES